LKVTWIQIVIDMYLGKPI